MGNPKKNFKHYTPSHYGTQPRESGVNKGKQMQMENDEQSKVIQTKGKK